MSAPPSAHEFEKQLAGLAYSAVGKQPPAKAQAPDVPLVPIYVGIDMEQPPQQLRETFLYRLGDDKWGVRPATSRLLLETGLPGGHTEKNVDDMIKAGLKPYTNSSSSAPLKGAGQMQLVKLQLYARKGDQVFRDEVVWDVGNPINSAQPYAVRVCGALRLGADWFDVIRSHLQQQLDDVRQDLLQAPHEVQLQQPVKRARKTPAVAAAGGSGASGGQLGVPRIEPYDPVQDVEAARVAARQQKLQQRQQAAGVQQQQQQQGQPQQGQPQQGQPQQGPQQQQQQQAQLPEQHQVGQMPPQQHGQQQLPSQLQAAQQQQQQQQQHLQQQHAHHGQQQTRLHHVPPGQVQAHMMQQQQPQQHVPQQPQR